MPVLNELPAEHAEDVCLADDLRSFLTTAAPSVLSTLDEVARVHPLSEKAARGLLKQWLEKHPFARRDIDPLTTPLTVRNSAALHCQFDLHVETRKTTKISEADVGSARMGDPPAGNAWGIALPPFKRASRAWVIPGTLEAHTCTECQGTRTAKCGKCRGDGKTLQNCPNCHGRGHVRADRVGIGSAGRGSRGAGLSIGTEQCLRCSATGKVGVPCSLCRGSGAVACRGCKETGRRRSYQRVQAQSVVRRGWFSTVPSSAFRPSWLEAAQGCDCGSYTAGGNFFARQSKQRLRSGAEVLVERFTARVVPITVVCLNGKPIYIVGAERRVRGAFSLLSPLRLLLGSVAALMTLILLLAAVL